MFYFKKRGQSQLESFMLFILILGLLLPVLFYSADKLGTGFRINQASDSLNSVAITANAVSNLGRGNVNTVAVSIPTGIEDSYVLNDSLVLIVAGDEITVDFPGKIVGNIPHIAGMHTIKIESLGGGDIKIGKNPHIIELNPSCVSYLNLSYIEFKIIGTDFFNVEKVYYDGAPFLKESIKKITNNEIIMGIERSFWEGFSGDNILDIQVKTYDGYFSNSVPLYFKPLSC